MTISERISRWLTILVLLGVLAYFCVTLVFGQPLPPVPGVTVKKAVKTATATTQGAGALALITPKAVVVPGFTNKLVFTWKTYPPQSQPFPGLAVHDITNSRGIHVLGTNWFEVQAKWQGKTNWVAVGQTNRGTPSGATNLHSITIQTTNRAGWFRMRSFML
jgi:hypothetical protein